MDFQKTNVTALLHLWILFVNCVSCHTVLSDPYSFVVTCWERADLLALSYMCFLTFSYDVIGQVWCLIVRIPDICLFCILPYFKHLQKLFRQIHWRHEIHSTLNKSSNWSSLEIGHPLRLVFAKNIKDMTLKFCIYNS